MAHQARDWYQKGLFLYNEGKFAEAIKYFRQGLELFPKDSIEYVQALYSTGAALHQLGRYEEAIVSYKKALKLDPEFANAKEALKNAQKHLALPEKGTSAEYYILNAMQLIAAKRYNEVYEQLERATEADAKNSRVNSRVWYLKGILHERLGSAREALEFFERAWKLKPEIVTWECSACGGVLDIKELNCPACGERVDERPQIVKESAAWTHMGITFTEQGHYVEAIKCFDKALEIDPEDAAAWYNKGDALSSLGNNKEAIKCYDRAIGIKPEHADDWYRKGILHERLGSAREALECFEKALKLKPEIVVWVCSACRGIYNLKELNCPSCGGRIIEQPKIHKGADAWCYVGSLFDAGRYYEEAIKCFDKALEIDPNHYHAWMHKALAIFEMGEFEEALKYVDKCIEANPKYPGPHELRAKILLKVKAREEVNNDAAKKREHAQEIKSGKPLTISPQTFMDLTDSLPSLKKYITFQKVKLGDLVKLVKKFFEGRFAIIAETEGKDQYGLDYAFQINDKNYILRITIVRNKYHGNISHLDFKISSRDAEDLPDLLEELTIQLSDHIEQKTSGKEVIWESREQKQSAEASIDEAIAAIAKRIIDRHKR